MRQQSESSFCGRCAGCKFARYASKEAQRAAWKNGHQQECAALQACGRIPPATIRLAARIYWKEQRCPSVQTFIEGSSHRRSGSRLLSGARNDDTPLQPSTDLLMCRLTGDGALPHSIESLEHHWEDLDDDRKQSYAQMAIVTRYLHNQCPA